MNSTELVLNRGLPDLLASSWCFPRPCQWGLNLENQHVPSLSSSLSLFLDMAFISLHIRAFPQVSQSPRVDVLTYLRCLHVLLPVLLLAGTQPPEILVSGPGLPPVSHTDAYVALMLYHCKIFQFSLVTLLSGVVVACL